MFTLGILGLGYLGQQVQARGSWSVQSWAVGAHQVKQPNADPLPFDWADPKTWDNLPCQADGLLLCIPPVFGNLSQERLHLESWGAWMNLNRPDIRRLVYLSTTGVYANEPELFDESSATVPKGIRGQLRLLSEQVLSQYFDLKVIRSGAIYGPGRSIEQRLLQGDPIPSDSGLVHRIHVIDLANICTLALVQPGFPAIVNGVDPNPASSLEVAQWVVRQPGYQKLKLNQEAGYLARKGFGSVPGRTIKSQQLEALEYLFTYPSYQDSLTQGGVNESVH